MKVGSYSEKWDDEKGNMLTIMGFQSIMMAGELGGNIGRFIRCRRLIFKR